MKRRRMPVNVDLVLKSLKEFQRRTVEYVFKRMYTDQNHTNRFLIADEVGLGKTLVARGLIAKVIEHLWNKIPRIDIVYICSNANIARQNINRLNVTEYEEFSLARRITLLPLYLDDYNSDNGKVLFSQRKLNFVSFTPGTSIYMKFNPGIIPERVLLYWLLKDAWNLKGAGPKNVLQAGAGKESFRRNLRSMKNESYDRSIAKEFISKLNEYCHKKDNANKGNIRERFKELCKKFSYSRKHIPPEENDERNRIIGELRSILAKTCLKWLEPDLIILDEFQRFSDLLKPESEERELAQALFSYADKHTEARVLLLSATPYKMYTLPQEKDEDHYADFFRTLEFLYYGNEGSLQKFKSLLDNYRVELFNPHEPFSNHLLELKREIELNLKKYMVRTERLAVSIDREGMLLDKEDLDLRLSPNEVRNYVVLDRIASSVKQSSPMEYWRSSPYLLNYMDEYALKKSFKSAIEDSKTAEELKTLIKQSSAMLLSGEEVKQYEKIDPCNFRLRYLIDAMIDSGLWKLLWLPPSMQYYKLDGVYKKVEIKKATKRLIFSSWRIVPKVIATILSYEVERNIFKSYDKNAANTGEARKRIGRLLRFAKKDNHLFGMSNFCILYPSNVLSRICDPLSYVKEQGICTPLSLTELKTRIRPKIEKLIMSVSDKTKDTGREDERWYWIAPVLIDLRENKKQVLEWFCPENLQKAWQESDDYGMNVDEEFESGWREHVESLREMVDNGFSNMEIGPMPKDLVDVLVLMGIASPGNVAMRALLRTTGLDSGSCTYSIRNASARIAWGFLRFFNLPESILLIRGIDRNEPYWQRVLEYCANGGIQMVLDEYMHCLRESLGIFKKGADDIAEEISDHILDVLGLRTVTLDVDNIEFGPEGTGISIERFGMRARFAQRFGQGKERAEDGFEETREDRVRSAFNSPFWPFIIATTSVGQEGLDFHTYCHIIVHWNLPSNPVDLEQREGRVHRYKGHAIRKNLCIGYWNFARHTTFKDPFEKMFAIAKENNQGRHGDIFPYWILPVDEGVKIERHVLALPLSHDLQRYIELKRALAVYRMVFGQNRQSDLIDLLLSWFPKEKISEISEKLRIDLSPQ